MGTGGTKYVVVLAGDHLYRMNYMDFLQYHRATNADITLAVQPVSAELAPAFGILKRNLDGQILSFTEKPKRTELDGLKSIPDSDKPYMASMGIYVFPTELLFKILEQPGDDFGKDIIPQALSKQRVMGYVFEDYWADIGTIGSFYEVNIEMAAAERPFDLYAPKSPIYTRPRFLTPSEVRKSQLDQVLIADGCKITEATINNSVIGLRSFISPAALINGSVIMGADYYETEDDRARNKQAGRPDVGIGPGSVIESGIVDKNARIGRNVHIRHLPDRPDTETNDWVVREGMVIVLKNSVIADDTVI
ncbi:MAG: sugar phosphate nucleotidyltransferase [Desulfoferrobacter sp.]